MPSRQARIRKCGQARCCGPRHASGSGVESNMDSNNVILAQSPYRFDRPRWRYAAVVVAIASHLVVTDAVSAQQTSADVMRAATVGQGRAPESPNDPPSPSPSIDNHAYGLADTVNLGCIDGIEGALGATVAIAFYQVLRRSGSQHGGASRLSQSRRRHS